MPLASVLHLLDPRPAVSPFDLQMAVDAGYQHVVPHPGADFDAVASFTRDAIFSRAPGSAAATALFLGGRSASAASAALGAVRGAFLGPFSLHALADPNGAFTAAASVAALAAPHLDDLRAPHAAVLGHGPVACALAVLLAQAGAAVSLVALSDEGVPDWALFRAFDLPLHDAVPPPPAGVLALSRLAPMSDALASFARGVDAVFSCARAGAPVLPAGALSGAPVRVCADLNAVPPAGITGVVPASDGDPLAFARPIPAYGPLRVGAVKVAVHGALLRRMLLSSEPLVLGLAEAREAAAEHLARPRR